MPDRPQPDRAATSWLGRRVEVVVEAPRGSRVKRRPDGTIDFVSPLPVPCNYGYVVGEVGGDGDPLDALVLGPALPVGHRGTWTVRGVVRFVDAGATDDKLVCGLVDDRGRRLVERFFRRYVVAKRLLHRLRRVRGATRVREVVWWSGTGSSPPGADGR